MVPTLLLAALLATPAAAATPATSSPTGSDSAAVSVAAPPVLGLLRPAPQRAAVYRPRHLLLQTGGGVGMLSVGGGLSFAHRHLDFDGLLGYVPARHAGTALTIASLKLKYAPWELPLGGSGLALTPLAVGVYGSYTFGVRNVGEDGQYPDDYYWWSRTMRVGPVLGSSLSYALPDAASGRARRLTAYYELATNDLYAISYYQNRRALSLRDIATLALGLKLEF
ncbi:hypothetical protein [Hymenobacter psychrophilus]|uniref:Outer membrane protein beta-barrel domain-containing protein n=1 Tax=Hymenobacter psychrophilus TaxID=651662 RepID=A0A1H3JCR5_9BACT|nr:hypothetical protein [Hymenobacter psychrophilus]SDY37702.1 hypothetical protein SAMN04488069_10818 [Hymenobacter psychrophilus]